MRYTKYAESRLKMNVNKLVSLIKENGANDSAIHALLNKHKNLTTFNSKVIKVPMSEDSTVYDYQDCHMRGETSSQVDSKINTKR